MNSIVMSRKLLNEAAEVKDPVIGREVGGTLTVLERGQAADWICAKPSRRILWKDPEGGRFYIVRPGAAGIPVYVQRLPNRQIVETYAEDEAQSRRAVGGFSTFEAAVLALCDLRTLWTDPSLSLVHVGPRGKDLVQI